MDDVTLIFAVIIIGFIGVSILTHALNKDAE